MPIQEKYTQRLGLANLDVFLDTPDNDSSYFTIGNLPENMGYGKHGFTISYNDPTDSNLLLKNNTGIIFEFVDANGNTVFSELSDIPDLSGAATGYVWVKKDPLWIAQEIANGPLKLYVVGELDGVPEEFQGTYNLRSTFTFNVRKSFPNTSKIIFYDVPSLEASASFTETQEEDLKPGYTRGYINVSSSFMQTHGGKVSFIELSYRETGSQANNFTVMTEYPVEGPTSRFEVSSGSADGLNPLSHLFKAPIPRSIRRDTPVVFKLRFLDADKTPAKYYDENRQNQNIEITSSAVVINGTPMVIEREDNLLKGSMFTGQAVGQGFETSGKSSAFMKTVDYTGFISASTHIGKSGIMFFSGSVLTGSGDDYKGVGLELVGDSESLFRFRSNPSVLDIKTREFFVGSSGQFISASQGKIEISSSRFHLDPTGNVKFSGSIDASSGRIGGFVISSSQIHSDVEGRRDLILRANGQISASSILLASSSFVIDPNNLQRYGQDGFGSFVMANSTGVSIQTTDFNLNTARFVISSSDVGVMAMGSNPPLNYDNGKGVYMSGDGNFLAGDSQGERIQFNGFNLVMSSSAFFLGNERSFMSGSQGKIRISGSDITIQTPQFFFGDATKFISGSNGNLEITSSRFHLDREGNVKLIGRIEAESGFLGGFGITQHAITGSGFFISGGAANNERFISSNNFNVKASGDITGSNVLFTGGKISGSALDVIVPRFFLGSETQFVSGSNGNIEISSSNFHLDNTGNVTMAGTVTATTGEIGGFNIGKGALSSDNFFISGAAQNAELFISSSGFSVDAQGIVSASALSLQGGDVGGLHVAEGTVSVGEILKLKDSGQITGSQVLFTGGKIAAFNLSNDAFSTDTFFISASATGNDKFISTSNFNIKASGDITGSQVLFSGGTIGGFDLSSNQINSSNDNLILKSSGQITASDANITGDIVANKITANTEGTIANFTVNSAEIKSSNNNLRLKSSGQITASDAQISGKITAESGTIGGFNIGTDLDSAAGTLKLKGATGQITASDAQITGKITAETGTIGGFNIGTDLDSTAGTLKLKGATGQITASDAQISGKITATSGEIGGFEIASTQINSSNDNLILKDSGQITGSTALFTGGRIAGWTISGTTLVGANATLDGAGSALFKTDAGPGSDSSATFDQRRDEYYIDFTPTQGPTNSAGQFYVKFGPNFSINSDGVLFASGAQFEGTVSASKGIIGGFTTDASSFSSANLFISGSPGIGGIHHPKYMFISSSNFNVKQTGDVTGSQVLFTGGKVGGWTMDDTTLTGGTVTLNSAGSIKVGNLADATTTATTNSGFFADNSGNVLIKGNVNNNDYLKISAGGGIDIRSQVFDLDAGTLVMDSATRSGTIALGATPNVNIDGTNAGVYMNGLGDFLVRVDANNFIKIDQDATTKLDMRAQTFFLGSGNQFISGSNGTIAISSSNFDLDTAGNVTMAGTVTATAGQIAGFTISGNSLTATNFEIDASGKRITLGDASSTDLFVADADEGIQLGNNTFGLAPFSVTKAGVLKAVAGTIGGFGISATAVSSSNNNLILKNNGQITGSNVLFNGGVIGGFTIDADEIKSTNLLLDSTNEKITVGSANAITIQGGGTDNFIVMGSKTAFAQLSTAGVILGMDNNVPSFDLTRNATNYMRFDTSTGVDIKTDTFKLDTATLDIDSSTSRIQVVNGSSNEVVRLGEISDSASDLYGLKVYDGSGTADSNTLVKLGGEGNTIGGWTITNDQIQSNNLIIHSSGRLETADFASGVKGWRIDSENNGTAEFENATIRGTLSTAVFEKETVNAVGGQLYVANSTVISGSGITSASFTTMSVVNVSGFVQGEIASLKKVSETGFSTEYVFINSASRNDRSSDTDFSGNLMVIRGYSGSLGGVTGSLGGAANSAQDYNPGQVLVSTGRVGTGYIRLNANPNDSATPYIDIVERTGSAIYDIELKTRVGDLSGLSSATLFGNSDPGFGIFTENGFFKGGINATTGSFTGVVHINTSVNEIMKLGTNVDSTNDGLHINNNNFWYTTGQFKTGNANNFISHDGNGNVKVISENFTLKGGSKLLMTSESLAFDTSNASTATRTAGTGVFMNDQGHFRVGVSDGNRLTFTGTSLELVTDDLNIDTSTFDLTTDSNGKIALGATPPTAHNSGTGVYMDGAGNFLAGNASGNHIKFDASSGAVNVAGTITISAGSDISAGLPAGTVSGSGQLADAISGSLGSVSASLASDLNSTQLTASAASSSAGQGISTANTANTAASNAQSTANTATAAASTAQSAIDTMETQVVLSSAGMDLRNNSNVNVATFGTTTKFFDGVGHADANRKLQLNADGVFAFGDDTDTFAHVRSAGMRIVSSSVEVAEFGSTTTIGNTSTEHVEITNIGLKLKDGGTTRLSMNSSGMQIGSVSNGITLNSSGDATFNGAITITGGDIAGLTGSLDSSIAGASASAAAGQSGSALLATQVVLDSNGMSLKNAAANKTLASFGTTVVIGENADDKSRMVLDNDSLDLIVDASGTDTTHASFGATTTIGPTATEHIEITSTALKIKDGNSGSPITHITINSSGMQLGSVSDGITLDTSGNATFNGTITLPSGTVSGSGQVSGITGSLSASLAPYETQVVLDSSGMSLKNTSGTTLASYGATTTIGINANDESRILIDNNSVDLIVDDSGVDTTFASFGAVTTVGNASAEHVRIDSDSVDIIQDANNKAVLNASGLTISQSGAGVAKFAGTTTIGNTGAEHLLLNTSGLTIKDNTTTRASILNTGVTLNGASTDDQLVVNSSGLTLKEGGNVRTTLASNTLTLGKSGEARTVIDDSSISMYDGQATSRKRVAIDNTGKAAFGGAAGADVSVTSTDDVIRITPGEGVSIFEDSNNFAVVDSSGLTITQSGAGVAEFASTTRIGNRATEHVEITSTSLKLKDATTDLVTVSGTTVTIGSDSNNRVQITPTSMQIGSTSGGITMDSNGDATFNGTITLPGGTVSGSSQVSGITGSLSASLAPYETQVQLSSDGMSLKDESGNTLADYGTTVTVGRSDALNQNVFIDSDSVDIRRGTQVTASFGATTTIGPVSSAHTFIDSGSLRLKDGSTERLVMDAKGIRMGSQFSVAANGTATFGGTLTIGNLVSSSAQLASAISGSSGNLSSSVAGEVAGLTAGSQSMQTQVKLSSDGMTLNQADGTTLASYGDAITLGLTSGTENNVFIDNDSVDIRRGTEISASFGSTTTIGPTSGRHVKITGTALEIKTNVNTTVLSASAAGLDMAGTIKASGGTIGGFDIGTDLDSQAGTLKLKGATGQITASDAQITGKITAETGTIGGFTIGSDLDSGAGTLKLKGATGQITASDAQITGKITAETGTIGGFTIGSDLDSTAGTLKLKGATGQITASDAQISGKITANAGNIGGYIIQSGQLTGSDGTNKMIITGSGLISAGDLSDPLKQAHFGVLVSSGQKFVSSSLAPNYPSAKIEDNFAGLNLYDSTQQTGLQLNYGNFFKIAGEDGGEAAFRVGKYIHTGANSTPAPYVQFTETEGLEISSSKFRLTDSDLLVNKVTATEGTIGGFTINGSEITGSSGAIISTAAIGQRVKISGVDNTIKFFEPGNNVLMDVGLISSLDFGSGNRTDFYGINLAGSAVSSKIESVAKITINNADALPTSAGVTNAYGSGFSNIVSRINLETGTTLLRGRPAIYGEFKSELTSNSATTGLASGVTGMIKEDNNGYWDMSAGVVGVSSLESANMDSSEGGGVPDGQYGVVSVGNAYVKGTLTATGDITGDLTGTADAATLAVEASNVTITDQSTENVTKYIIMADGYSGKQALEADQGLTYNNLSGALTTNGPISVGGGYGSTGITLEADGDLTMNGDLTVDDFASLDSARIGATATDPGTGNLYVENDLTVMGKIFQGEATQMAALGNMTYASTYTTGDWEFVTLQGEFWDIGSDMDYTSGERFNAPVDGIYYFSLSLLLNSATWAAGNNVVVGFSVNGATTPAYHRSWVSISAAVTDILGGQTSGQIKLDAGDYVKPMIFHNRSGGDVTRYDGSGAANYNNFGAHLVMSLT